MAVIGVTCKLEHESGSSWVEVPHCKVVSFPGFNISSIDTTNHGNADYAKTFMPGMIDPGTYSYECEYTSAVYNSLIALVRQVIGWRMSSPTSEGDTVTCDGFLTKLDINSSNPDDEMMISFEIKYTGLPTVS